MATREYVWRPPVGPPRPVRVEIGPPGPHGREWSCRLRIVGLPKTIDRPVFGVDAVQALELALVSAGTELSSTPQFRAGQLEYHDAPMRQPAALFLPLPMTTLKQSLDSLRALLETKSARPGLVEEWRQSMLAVMREIRADFATLVAHLPLEPKFEKKRTRHAK